MTANLATVDDRLLAREGQGRSIRNGFIVPDTASDKPQIGGMQFDRGHLSPYFITDPERMEVAFDNSYVLVHEGTISSRKDLLPLLEQITKTGRPLLIIAEDVEGEALAALVVNKLRGQLQVAAVRAPGLGEQRKSMLHNIALRTGGKPIAKGIEFQLSVLQTSDLGQARRITVDRSHTSIDTSGSEDALQRIPMSLVAAAGVPPEFDS